MLQQQEYSTINNKEQVRIEVPQGKSANYTYSCEKN